MGDRVDLGQSVRSEKGRDRVELNITERTLPVVD